MSGEGFQIAEAYVDVKVDDQTDPGIAKKLLQVRQQLDAVAAAEAKVQDAQGKAAVAQAKVNDLRDQGNVSSAKLTAAEQAAAKATRDVELAQQRLTTAQLGGQAAQRELVTSQDRARQAADDLAKAQRDAERDAIALAQAEQDAADKQRALAGVQDALTDAHRRANDQTVALAKADDRLGPAVKRVQDAQSSAYLAQLRLTELRSKGTASASQMASAEEAVARSERNLRTAHLQLEDAQNKLATSGDKARKSEVGMLDWALALGPALIPLAAELAAVGGAAVAMGGVAVLAFKGASKAMQDGTGDGIRYSAAVSTIKGDLTTLEDVASHGVLDAFERSVANVDQRMPQLSFETKIFSGALGDIAGYSIDTVLGGFETFTPLLQHAASYMDTIAQRADKWANGPGGAHFADALGHDLDQAAPALENIVSLFARLIAAGNGAGVGILTTFGQIAGAIDDIPMPVLSALVQTLVVLKTMKIVGGVFDSIGGSLENLGGKAGGANTKLGATLTTLGKFAGGAGAVAGAAIGLNALARSIGKSLQGNDSLNASLDNSGSAYSSFYNAIVQANGAIDDSVRTAVGYQLQQDKLIDKAGKAGISQDQLTTAVTGTDAQYKQLIATWKAQGKPADDTIKALGNIRNEYINAYGPAEDYINTQKWLVGNPTFDSLQTTASSLKIVASAYGLTADQAKNYATMAGLTDDEISNGAATQGDLAAAVRNVASAYDVATVNGQAFLAQVQQFSQSTGTDADRAALISATLKSAAGDALSYATTLNQAAVAEHGLTDQITQAAQAVGKNGESTKAYLDSIVNLKTGTIDYNNAAAAPLLTSLGQIQDAALQAASAAFQHNKAIGMDGKAAADQAYQVYTSQTGPMLEKQLTSLGLNRDAAHKLAVQYEGVPDKVKTLIEQEGADPVVTVLKSIDKVLVDIARAWGINVDADTGGATGPIGRVQAQLQALRDKHVRITTDIVTNYIQSGNKIAAGSSGANLAMSAAGGGLPEGWSTVGEGASNTWELVHKQGSQVQVYSNAQAKTMLPGGPGTSMVPGYAGGTVNGKTYATDVAYHNALTSLRGQQAQVRLTLDTKGIPALLRAVSGTTSGLNSSLGTLLSELQQADKVGIASTPFVKGIAHENSQLLAEAKKRDAVAAQIKTADAKLTAERQAWTTEQAKIQQAFLGAFDITTAGSSNGVGSTDRVLASLEQDVKDAEAFSAELARLRKMGLNTADYEALAAGGPESANALAFANATQADIDKENYLRNRLNVLGASTGTAVANTMYQQGIQAAQGIVKGLQSQEGALEKQMTRLANVMVGQIKHDLKIHSPSKEGIDIGENFGGSIAGGVDNQHPKLAKAIGRYGATMTSLAGQPGASGGGMGGMHIDHLEVHLHADDIPGLARAADFFTNLEQTVRAGVN